MEGSIRFPLFNRRRNNLFNEKDWSDKNKISISYVKEVHLIKNDKHMIVFGNMVTDFEFQLLQSLQWKVIDALPLYSDYKQYENVYITDGLWCCDCDENWVKTNLVAKCDKCSATIINPNYRLLKYLEVNDYDNVLVGDFSKKKEVSIEDFTGPFRK